MHIYFLEYVVRKGRFVNIVVQCQHFYIVLQSCTKCRYEVNDVKPPSTSSSKNPGSELPPKRYVILNLAQPQPKIDPPMPNYRPK